MRRRTLSLAALLLLEACGGAAGDGDAGDAGPPPSSGTNRVFSCTWTGDSCREVTGLLTPGDVAALQASCTAASGTPAVGGCETEATVAGWCQYSSTGGIGVSIGGATLREFYFAASWDPTTAAADCGGVWTGGGGGGTVDTVSCMSAAYGYCDQYSGTLSAADLTTIETYCGGYGGTYATAPCPAADQLPGHCDCGSLFATEAFWFLYYSPIFDSGTAAADCVSLGGAWVP